MTSNTAESQCPCCGGRRDGADPCCEGLWRSELGRQEMTEALGFRWDDPRAANPTAQTEHFPQMVDGRLTAYPGPVSDVVKQILAAGQRANAASLSEWKSGHTLPYLTERTRGTMLALERVIGARTGEILAALGRGADAQGRDGWEEDPAPVPADEAASGPSRQKALLEEKGFTNRGALTIVSRREVHTFVHRRLACVHLHHVVCALRDGVDTFSITYTQDNFDPVELVPGNGCRKLHRDQRRSDEYTVFGHRLRLTRRLAAYEFHEFDLCMANTGYGDPVRLARTGLIVGPDDPGCGLHEVRVRFFGETPKEVREVTKWNMAAGEEPVVEAERLVTSENWQFLLRRPNPGPIPVGYRWEWLGATEAPPRIPIGRR